MSINLKYNPGHQEGIKTGGNPGNASNPSPINENQTHKNQLLDEKAEKYLRESGNIEDMPDPQEQQDAERMIEKESRQQSSTD
jgi:hypothetical protein